MADLFNTLQHASRDPTNYIHQSQLLEATREQVPFYSQLCSTTKKAATKIADLNKKQDMNSTSQETTDNLGRLLRFTLLRTFFFLSFFLSFFVNIILFFTYFFYFVRYHVLCLIVRATDASDPRCV
jgi:hypothetical protein